MAIIDNIQVVDDQLGDALSPSDDTLYNELRTVRTRGVGNPGEPLLGLTGLLQVARIISSKGPDAEKIEDALRQAIEHRGGAVEVIQALLGLTDETRGQGVKARRSRAAELHDYKEYEYFRTRIEPPLLMGVATHLSFLVLERRWASEREALLATYSRSEQADNVSHQPATDKAHLSYHDTDVWTIFRRYDQKLGERTFRIDIGVDVLMLDLEGRKKLLPMRMNRNRNPSLRRPVVTGFLVGGLCVLLSLLGVFEGVTLLISNI